MRVLLISFFFSQKKDSKPQTTDGSLYGMGRSQEGELGIKSNEKNLFYPEEITFFKQFSQNGVKIKDVFAGGKSSFVLMENGEVFGFGYNNFGELGLGEGFLSFFSFFLF